MGINRFLGEAWSPLSPCEWGYWRSPSRRRDLWKVIEEWSALFSYMKANILKGTFILKPEGLVFEI